jgi:hypothetical protein
MRIFGFYIGRRAPNDVDVSGASLTVVWVAETPPSYYEHYYADHAGALRSLKNGGFIRKAEALKVGDRYFLVRDALKEISVVDEP